MKNSKKIVVSACLAGINCKYDGGNNVDPKILKLLEEEKIILVCPEELGGMTTPRIASEIVNDKVLSKTGLDVTKEFNKGATEALKIAISVDADTAILQQRSPSCGSKLIYDGSFKGKLVKGKGVTTKLFEEKGIKVLTIDDI